MDSLVVVLQLGGFHNSLQENVKTYLLPLSSIHNVVMITHIAFSFKPNIY